MSLAQQINNLYKGLSDRAEEYLEERGVSTKYLYPEIPTDLDGILRVSEGMVSHGDLTRLDSEQLGKIWSFYGEWRNYLQSMCTEIDNANTEMTKLFNAFEALIRTELKTKGVKSSDMKDQLVLYVNEEGVYVWMTLDAKLTEIKLRHKKAEMVFNNCRASINTISREMTRVGADAKFDKRDNNVRRSTSSSKPMFTSDYKKPSQTTKTTKINTSGWSR